MPAWTTAAASETPRSQATYTNSNQFKDLLPNYVPNNGLPLINLCWTPCHAQLYDAGAHVRWSSCATCRQDSQW